ncbi:putative response regulator receiver protein [Magnetofaba australis IT-1]|uniref:Putative response regulator receiver protein n=1 Tax=Magnetofaba australis IT-1 TaxID=1434232 RepID=A0A1Y2JZQ0_9PROT|nr:putative response regulator receiver protein [Magnetofaba australis IT-1]
MLQPQANPLNILLVEDDDEMRLLFVRYLRKWGYIVHVAENGREAIHAYGRVRPDLVLMDRNMPDIDGFEACMRIKAQPHKAPVIIITGMTGRSFVDIAYHAGADDFIAKPVNWDILRHRIADHIHNKRIDSDLNVTKSALVDAYQLLDRAHEKLRYERGIIEEILTRMRQSAPFVDAGFQSLFAPVDATSGDMLLSATAPDNSHYLFVGDITGHGLPAALIAPMISDVFYSMTAKGFSSGVILREMNRKIREKLPRSLFLAGAWLALDPSRRNLFLWMGGMPPGLWLRENRLIRRLSSTHVALGMICDAEFDANGEWIHLQPEDHVVIFSDGVIETHDACGTLYGDERAVELIMQTIEQERPFSDVKMALDAYHGAHTLPDDVTILDLIS